jgi:hypothetical protein
LIFLDYAYFRRSIFYKLGPEGVELELIF